MMRLTLRTLLAYLDGLLERDDAQDISKKIEQSEFATKLFHRIRDVMRRIRLSAPSLTERGQGLDANTVAEYLDNILPADRVPDFEKVCLESDVHLAEVASSHQILTLVLGEPMEIDPASRQRMYQIPQVLAQAEEEHVAAAAATGAISGGDGPAAQDAFVHKSRPKPMVPEYLREPSRRRRLLPVAAMLLVAGGLAGILLLSLGQFEQGTPLGDGVQWLRTKIELASGSARVDTPADEPAEKAMTPKSNPEKTGAAPDETEKAEVPPVEGKPATAPDAEKTKGPAVVTPVVKEKAEPATLPLPAPDAKPAEPIVKTPEQVAKLDVPPTAKPGAKLPAEPEIKLPAPTPAVPEAKPVPAVEGKPNPPAEDLTPVARFMSDAQELLLKLNSATSTWHRVAVEELLVSRQPLVALPTYRPRLVIMNVPVGVEMLSGTRIELLAPAAQSPPGIEVAFGRVVIKPLAQAGARIRLAGGSHSGAITLATLESTAALEVTRVHQPATDPETEPSRVVAVLYVAQGDVVWEEEGAKKQPVRLTGPTQLVLGLSASDLLPGIETKELPKWIAGETISPLDRGASIWLTQAIQANRPASLVLMELTDHRRMEVRWLAARSLGYLDKFEPIVAALNDATFKREWPVYFDLLRQAVARGPATARAVRQAMEKQFAQEGPALYRMLWGYTNKDLESGVDAQLVKCLDHETLAFRVLAFSNLRDITGKGHYYQPELATPARQQFVQRWRQSQEAGEIRSNAAGKEKPGRTQEAVALPPAATPPSVSAKPSVEDKPAAESDRVPPPPPRPGGEKVSVPEPSVDAPEEYAPTPRVEPRRAVVPEPAP